MSSDRAGEPAPLVPFDEACALVVAHLKKTVPMACWSVTRVDGGKQVMLSVQDDAFGMSSGDSVPWSDSFCRHMVRGDTPRIAPDAMTIGPYADAAIGHDLQIGAYIGIPILDADGSLFGTLCGFDPTRQPAALMDQEPMLHLVVTLLEQILLVDRSRDEAASHRGELQWRAVHDPLTGLPNRGMFLDAVGRALRLATSHEPAPQLVVLDLDDFQAVNDTFGHAVGDDLLCEVGRRLRAVLRPTDLLARLAGDEFAVLLAGPETAAAMAQRLRVALQPPFAVGGKNVTITASIGVSGVPGDTPDVEPHEPRIDALLARADIAMYAAKHAGKDRIARHSPTLTLPGMRDLTLREPLRRALRTGDVTAAFQPIFSLATGRTVAFESLARWTHAGAPIAPDVFVPVASRGGMMPALTDLMLDHAATQLARWSGQPGYEQLRIGVNISPQCITDPALPDRVAACASRHGIDAGRLALEITEEALLDDVNTAIAVAHALREQGVSLSLDDFGTGYSSLLHLHQIPLASLKIDRGFAADLDTNPATQHFMRALLSLGRDLGLAVIVEGVARPEQADALLRIGGDFAQGYLFGYPSAIPQP